MTISPAILELKALLENAFPGCIKKVVLFGSQVKGCAREGSDYDVLVITRCPVDWSLNQKIDDIAYDVDLKHDVLIDVHVFSEDDMKTIQGRQPFVLEALETGVAA